MRAKEQEFLDTLNEMEQQDVPREYIDEYAKTEILRRCVKNVKEHATKMKDIRVSPTRYTRVEGKVKTINPYAHNKSMDKRRTMMDQANFSSLGGRAHGTDHSPSPGRVGMTIDQRGSSPLKGNPDKFYQPDIGEIPRAPLTKVRREKLA